jgi:hypothetical protein
MGLVIGLAPKPKGRRIPKNGQQNREILLPL